MNDRFVQPTRLLRTVAGCAKGALYLLLAAYLVLALAWGVLHGWIVPRIGNYRAQIENQATAALGIPVRLGSITAHSEGLVPTVELGGVALLDAQGREALRLPRVVLALSPRSLWNFGFEQLYIEGPQLDIRRTPDGRILLAGLELPEKPSGDDSGADWFFDQPELVIRGGLLRYTDEQRAAPPLALQDVDMVVRNGNWRHSLRIDATPPPEWGTRFTLVGQFRQPLLSLHAGRWRQWSGQLFAQFPQVDVSQLRQHAELGVTVAAGRGALRAWVDVERGQWVGGTADVALADVNATLAEHLQPLILPMVQGRLGGRRAAGTLELSTRNLQFTTDDGLRWPGGNVRLRHTEARRGAAPQGQFEADRLDLAALARIADRLPLDEQARQALRTYVPQGVVQTIAARWQGPLTAPTSYQAQGRVAGLSLAGRPRAGSAGTLGPSGAEAAAPGDNAMGLRGANVDFDLNHQGGSATVTMAQGALVLPGVFEEPVLPLEQLHAGVKWQIDGERIAVQVNDARFANADAQGTARATWRTGDAAPAGSGEGRFPGVLDLSGTLTRADGTRVHRYLPLSIPPEARHYVRDSVQAGKASDVQFRVRGDLRHMPFNDPRQGEFRIAAKVRDVTFAFVPPGLQPAGELPWPVLEQLGGELIFERSSMRVRDASGRFAGHAGLQASKVQAEIADLAHTVVGVQADARGPLPELLALLKGSPLAAMVGHALDDAQGSGAADLKLRLNLPIANLAASKVQGALQLAGNDVRITPDTPALARARGTVQFSESGFTLSGVQARALGGDVRLEGGMRPSPSGSTAGPVLQLRAQGTATAEGLRQARELGLVAQLAQKASGSTAYVVNFGVRRGVPELQVSTQLQGLALALPAPLGKVAETPLPVRFENQLTRAALAFATPGAAPAPLQDRLVARIEGVGGAEYLRDLSGAAPRVVQGSIALAPGAQDGPTLPEGGVSALLQLGDVDVDAWQALLTAPPGAAPGAPPGPDAATTLQDYLPQVLAASARTVTVQGRTLHDVVVGGSRQGLLWRANVDARELGGYVEYRQAGPQEPGSGRLYARLARLGLPQNTAAQVETMLDAQQPASLPALDIAVDDFELRGMRLGRLEIDAQNRALDGGLREWRLGKFNLITPEAQFMASGNWAALQNAGNTSQRRTVLNYRLDIQDAGQLLARLNMPGTLRRGKGHMEGQIAWRGAPISPDYRSMTGQTHLDIEAGQFLKADPGLAKLLGVLSLQALPRRLTLDFRDVFSEGFSFDFVRGDLRIEQGVATTNNLQMKGVNAAVLMEGSADIAQETQNLHVVVVPEINAMTASLVATAINPVVGLGSFLAQVFLRGPLIEAATQEFQIDGSWSEPRVTKLPRRQNPAAPAAPASAAQPLLEPASGAR